MGTHEPAATLGAGQSSQRREAGPPAIKGESTWQKAITAPATSWKRKCARKVWASLKTRRSEEHTSELQSLMRISYAVFCLKKKKKTKEKKQHTAKENVKQKKTSQL